MLNSRESFYILGPLPYINPKNLFLFNQSITSTHKQKSHLLLLFLCQTKRNTYHTKQTKKNMITRESQRLSSVTIMILMVTLVWSVTLQTCIARKGRHWRHHHSSSSSSSTLSDSLSSKKPKSHHNSHSHKSKPQLKTPPPKSGSPVLPQPPQVQPPPSPQVQPPPPSPLPLQPLEGSQEFNVLDFGAKGDGMSDDTEVQIQNISLSNLKNSTYWFLIKSKI